MQPVRVAMIGYGKIARDQHVDAIAGDPALVLAATVDPATTGSGGVPHFPTLAALIDSGVVIDAAAICTPPQSRFALAGEALAHGWHLLLEKPPCATLAQCDLLAAEARRRDLTLFAAWHSRFAPGLRHARAWLAGRRIERVDIAWKESIRKWHPGQKWIGQAGGLGVFDPAINALSMLTSLIAHPVEVRHAALGRPANWAMPIAGRVECASPGIAGGIGLDLDFDHAGAEIWDLQVTTTAGETMVLRDGGSRLTIDAADIALPAAAEYAGVYGRFAALIAAGASDFDTAPLAIALHATHGFPMAEIAAFTE